MKRYSPRHIMLMTGVAIMFEGIAKDVSERVLNLIRMIADETVKAAREGNVAYATMSGLEKLFEEGELETLFQILPVVVLVSDEIRELNAKEFVSPVYGLTAEADQYFRNQPKYTPAKKYRIFGADVDMKQNLFKYIVNDEANNDSAIVEVVTSLDGVINQFSMMPWGNETHMTVDSGLNLATWKRRSRNAPWE
jgi:hypothetical protein